MSLGVLLFNQSAFLRAIDAYENAILAFEGSRFVTHHRDNLFSLGVKLHKCVVLKVKALNSLAHEASNAQELLEQSVSLVKNSMRWLQTQKAKKEIKPKIN